MHAKETLQLRHQLACSGLSIRAATYDTRRHHVLTYDSHPLRPHVLRLFSLRREIKYVALFDKSADEDAEAASVANTSGASTIAGRKKLTYYEQLQLQQQQQQQQSQCAEADVVVPSMMLTYSPALDVYICVYTSAALPPTAKRIQTPIATTYSVLVVEPASLRKLLVYSGPATHLLQCVHYDPSSDRLVLASHLASSEGSGSITQDEVVAMLPGAPRNMVEVLQISTRQEESFTPWITPPGEAQQEPQPQSQRTLLYIEKLRTGLRHPDKLELICGSHGLRELYGSVAAVATESPPSDGSSPSTATPREGALLEWRQNPEGGKFVLTRRVMLREGITAMALSPGGDWLFVGLSKGGLKVWNVNGSQTNASTMFTPDSAPYQPMGATMTSAQKEILSSIKVNPVPSSSTGSRDATAVVESTEAMVITTERDSGAVRHWRFLVERRVFGGGDAALSIMEHRLPQLQLVGFYCPRGGKQHVNANAGVGSKRHNIKLALEPPLKTLTICVNVDMGSCVENLLLVLRDDVMHVLKVQTVLHVLHEFSHTEEVYAVRAVASEGRRKVLCLSGTACSNLRVLSLNEGTSEANACQFFYPPPPDADSRVLAVETVRSGDRQTSFVVLAWSNGMVDVYDLAQRKRVLLLQDPHLNDRISALSVTTLQRATGAGDVSARTDESSGISSPSWRGLLKYQTPKLTVRTSAGISDSDMTAIGQLVVVAGTESGQLFGWKVDGSWTSAPICQLVLKASTRAEAAHSTHIVQLTPCSGTMGVSGAMLASVAADGIVKVWGVRSLRMLGHLNTAIGGHTGVPSCIEVIDRRTRNGKSEARSNGEFFVLVGYEDGRLAVWRMNPRQVSFQELEVSARHERRVSQLCGIPTTLASTGMAEFLSCSLDMTVLQWAITESGSVLEKRYFEVGAAIVDMTLSDGLAVVALAHEICKFMYTFEGNVADSSTADSTDSWGGMTLDHLPTEEGYGSEAASTSSGRLDRSQGEPSARSVGTSSLTTSRQTARSADEYLTLHVPSILPQPESTTPGSAAGRDITGDALFNPASSGDQKGELNPRDEDVGVPRESNQVSDRNSQPAKPPVDDKVLLRYLEDYITHHGTDGTMAAGRLTHLLALKRDLPTVKRLQFTLAKCLQEQKVTAKARVTAGEGVQILRALFAATSAPRLSFDAPTVTHTMKHNILAEGEARKRKKHEAEQARRKPVVTYNLLGEKYVRWKCSVDGENTGGKGHQEDIAGSGTPMVVHTPKSPPTKDLTGPMGNVPPIRSESPPKTSKEDNNAEISGNNATETDGDSGGHTTVEKIQPGRPNVSAEGITLGPLGEYLPGNALVCNITLSPSFREFWSKGYCWCRPAPKLHVLWKDPHEIEPSEDGTEEEEEDQEDEARRQPACEVCRKRLHTLNLPRIGYKPHFSRRATLAIILEVYSKLTASAHMRLYKKSSLTSEASNEFSIFGVLFSVFKDTYGMLGAVETKLKQFFVSMCHFLREHDAIAVFGELLELHTPDSMDEKDRIPSDLVAICVCCYSWFYSRGMVVNGDGLTGHSREGARERFHDRVAELGSEAVLDTDGRSNWQFVKMEHALLCAQENLLYPLVSPGFLRNILLFMQEYAQLTPTRPVLIDSETPGDGDDSLAVPRSQGPALWIELHRFLRLVVAEWKQQNAEFRVVESLLFTQPPSLEVVVEADFLEKLRLLLSCFIFYDHERVGMMAIGDFEQLMYKLRYIWQNELEPATLASRAHPFMPFESAVLAAKKRFVDLDRDGQLCYLDFWALLYVVGSKTHTLLKLRELPSFCRDYKLEITPELRDMLLRYMQLSCTLLLPIGLQVGKSSLDQKAGRQHRRRAGGLHDGVFNIEKTLGESLSMQDLLSGENTPLHGLFVDGSTPAVRQSSSVSALDRFRPVSVDSNFEGGGAGGFLHRRGQEPVVMGVRPIGPTPKPIAPLRMSVMPEGSSLASSIDPSGPRRVTVETVTQRDHARLENSPQLRQRSVMSEFNEAERSDSMDTYTSLYIQFPLVPPRRWRMGSESRGGALEYCATQVIGHIPSEESSSSEEDDDKEGREWDDALLRDRLYPEDAATMHGPQVRQDKRLAQEAHVIVDSPTDTRPPFTRSLSSRKNTHADDDASLLERQPQEGAVVEPREAQRPRLGRTRSMTTVVVVPSIEKDSSESPANSTNDAPQQGPSQGLQRAASESDCVEDTAALLDVTEGASAVATRKRKPKTPVKITREFPPEETKSEASENADSGDDDSIDESEGEEDESSDEKEKDFPEAIEDESALSGDPGTVQDEQTEEMAQAATKSTLDPAVSSVEAANSHKTAELSSRSDSSEEGFESSVVGDGDCSFRDEEALMPESAESTARAEEFTTPAPESAHMISNVFEGTEMLQYPQTGLLPTMKEPSRDPKIHHTFRFSRQPAFLSSVTVVNNPFRTTMWTPHDDTDSDEDDGGDSNARHELSEQEESDDNGCFDTSYEDDIGAREEGEEVEEQGGDDQGNAEADAEADIEAVRKSGDVSGKSTDKGLPKPAVSTAHSPTFKPAKGSTVPGMAKPIGKPMLHRAGSLTRLVGAENPPPQPYKREKKIKSRERQGVQELEPILDEVNDTNDANDGSAMSPVTNSPPTSALKPGGRVRLDEEAERALYGERVLHALGEGIVFSAEVEAEMQQKWQQFFSDSEESMFSMLRQDMEKKQADQRNAEERQSKLRKKWQEQQDQDLQRLQQSRQNSTAMLNSGSSTASPAAAASFRLQRIHRESSYQTNQELEYGVSVQGECNCAKETQHFHFHYLPDIHGSIVTLKLHVLHGDAEAFMSTDTKVPCATDFMWRSVQKTAKESNIPDEGQKIMLYPHDLLRVVTAAAANAASSEEEAALHQVNASTASLRSSFQAKQLDASPIRVVFYLSVVALEPNTVFTLAVMTSGQKIQPSRAIQTVDYLIDRFNELSRPYRAQAAVFIAPQKTKADTSSHKHCGGSADDSDSESTGSDDDNEGRVISETNSSQEKRRRRSRIRVERQDVEDANTPELKSFQHLLETLSEKNGCGPPRSTSFLLSGPSEEHFEFVQDEEARLQEVQQRFSPPKMEQTANTSEAQDALTYVTERRLTLQGKRQKLRRVVAARLQKKLAPLDHHGRKSPDGSDVLQASEMGLALDKSASTGAQISLRVAKSAPRPVAYSLTTLDPLPHGHHAKAKASTAPAQQSRQRQDILGQKGAQSAATDSTS